jgi:hypothetical protein
LPKKVVLVKDALLCPTKNPEQLVLAELLRNSTFSNIISDGDKPSCPITP